MTDSETTTTSTPAPAPAAAPAGAAQPRPRPAAGGRSRDDDDRPRGRTGGRRRRVCIMCADHMKYVDYKNVSFLRRFVSDRARIETRRRTSACAKHQRAISNAIKRARHLALLPYTPDHIRISQGR
ncbi:MAG: 30S ribosomal protein S18 [Chloroflexi bacterium]|nr:30S ribosomal protein S18 [Chloroflexota bacterium]MCH7953005.1 30S ribosomal protein S18 [Chloroflexota bacterium]MCI0784532.1 30S ribosomal protein S18 [Chloroflexota bacterium]MCI0814231.1 30S ribosomal protein S18 [Chloroflexota bacterium]MCI0818561.1 30S ribosomal protein S18 [Chloroflexota bacterium]